VRSGAARGANGQEGTARNLSPTLMSTRELLKRQKEAAQILGKKRGGKARRGTGSKRRSTKKELPRPVEWRCNTFSY